MKSLATDFLIQNDELDKGKIMTIISDRWKKHWEVLVLVAMLLLLTFQAVRLYRAHFARPTYSEQRFWKELNYLWVGNNPTSPNMLTPKELATLKLDLAKLPPNDSLGPYDDMLKRRITINEQEIATRELNVGSLLKELIVYKRRLADKDQRPLKINANFLRKYRIEFRNKLKPSLHRLSRPEETRLLNEVLNEK